MFRPFQGDGPNPLALLQQDGFFPGDKGEQSADGRQPGVSGAGGTTPLSLQVIQESHHHLFGDILDDEPIKRSAKRVGRVTQHEFDGIAIGQHSVDRETFLHGQVVTEEAFH
jgi:hypothetical protein